MKTGKVRAIACVLIAVFAVLCACGGGETTTPDPGTDGGNVGKRPQGTKIVIYAGGSSEFSWVKGSEEEDVIEAIEEAYWQDTRRSLDFEIAYLGQNMKSKLQSELSAGSQVDIAISHTRGGDGIDDWVMANNQYYELTDVLYDLGPNVLNAVQKSTMGDDYLGTPLDSLTTYQGDIIGIPSVINPYKFGILVRKDYMEACRYTDDPELAATGEYELVDNLETFGEMCLAINELTGNTHAVTGAAWDWEKAIVLGAYTDAGTFTNAVFEINGEPTILSGGSSPEYGQVLKLEYEWAKAGILNPNGSETPLETAEAEFISGTTGVFVQDPTIQRLIRIARLTKENNPEAEFTVLGALTADKESTRKGFMRNMEATFAACIMKQSTNAERIIHFLNWVYKDADNYNLCRYGVEGVHWIDNGDGTYSYPEGTDYDVRPAYSGILTLVENQNMSDLIYEGYTEEELRWINEIAGNPDNYIDNDLVDYLFVTTPDMKSILNSVQIYPTQNGAWKGSQDPYAIRDEATGQTQYDYISSQYIAKTAAVSENYMYQYNIMKARRQNAQA